MLNCIFVCIILLKPGSVSQGELGSPSPVIAFILEGTHNSDCELEMGAARSCHSLPLAVFKTLDKESAFEDLSFPALQCICSRTAWAVRSVPDPEDLMCPFCSYKMISQTNQCPSQRGFLCGSGTCLQCSVQGQQQFWLQTPPQASDITWIQSELIWLTVFGFPTEDRLCY